MFILAAAYGHFSASRALTRFSGFALAICCYDIIGMAALIYFGRVSLRRARYFTQLALPSAYS